MGAASVNRRPALRWEDAFLTALATVSGPLLWWLGSRGMNPVVASDLYSLEFLVASACAGLGAVLSAWWLLALGATALVGLGQHLHSVRLMRWGHALSPGFVRRVAAATLGLQLLATPGAWAALPEDTTPGGAGSPPGSNARHQVPAAVSALPTPAWLDAAQRSRTEVSGEADLPTPTWTPVTPAAPAPGASRSNRAEGTAPVVATVRVGDCLWDIAAEELGPYATDLEIDRRWRLWYRHNADAIGADPDAISPGTVL
ncbi:MAG TPA: hypothetical protein VIG75_02710, partial [Citricoccus sp.]